MSMPEWYHTLSWQCPVCGLQMGCPKTRSAKKGEHMARAVTKHLWVEHGYSIKQIAAVVGMTATQVRYYSSVIDFALRVWWSRQVLRATPLCLICGQHAKHAHHIFPREWFPEAAYNPANGVGLCRSCHIRWHDRMRHRGKERLAASHSRPRPARAGGEEGDH